LFFVRIVDVVSLKGVWVVSIADDGGVSKARKSRVVDQRKKVVSAERGPSGITLEKMAGKVIIQYEGPYIPRPLRNPETCTMFGRTKDVQLQLWRSDESTHCFVHPSRSRVPRVRINVGVLM